MSCCSINEEHQNDSYQSLMLGNHLSKLNSLVCNIFKFILVIKVLSTGSNIIEQK